MLSHLVIKNYALIENLEVNPTLGLNIITGETGAGKSIMLGALGLLLGNRADGKSLFNSEEKCVIEANFEIEKLGLKVFFDENDLDYDHQCVIRREIASNGKSRAFINDSPVTLDLLKNLGSHLIDIHSQHETLLLANNSFQLNLVDTFAQTNGELSTYKSFYIAYKEAEVAFDFLKKNANDLKKEYEYNSFLLSELQSVPLASIDVVALEEELNVLENAEELKRKLSNAFQILNHPEQSALNMMVEVNSNLNAVAQISDKYKDLKERFQSAYIEIQDITNEIESIEEKIETNNAQVILLKDQLNLLFKLQTKHNVKTVNELIQVQNDLENKVNLVLNLDADLITAEKQKNRCFETANHEAQILSKKRLACFDALTAKLESILFELGMPDAKISFVHQSKNLALDGIDAIELQFCANKGGVMRNLKEVASGGEFSRLMLAFKYVLADKNQLPTIIFDEIDSGISGEVALKMGKILADMAQKMQVVCITHLHQIAGKGKTHFFVYKDNSQSKTVSLMKKLNHDERIVEVAKMIGGHNPSENAIRNAIEMLENVN